MEVGVVGPLEATRSGHSVALAPKERVVLARLALAAGGTVSDDALREAVWPRAAPPTAAKTLAGYVHRLRRALGADVVTRRPTGYRLDLDQITLDVVALDEEVATARRAVLSGDRKTAVSAYRRALGRFRGTPFEELDDVEEAVVERARLREVRNCAHEELHEVLLAGGDAAELVPSLEALLAREPTRERAWGQLISALARCGRQADALDAYARARRSLALELGIEPSLQLQALHRQVIEQDRRLLLADRAGAAPGRGVVPLDRLVGRDQDVDRIAEAFRSHRLLSLVGSGGAGKTRLAEHVVEANDDAYVVELAPVGPGGVFRCAAPWRRARRAPRSFPGGGRRPLVQRSLRPAPPRQLRARDRRSCVPRDRAPCRVPADVCVDDEPRASADPLVAPSSQAAFRRLAVFPRDFDADAARAVVAGDPVIRGDELAALAALVEASLVMVDRRPGAPNRYRLLDTVRRHAERRLDACDERAATNAALLDWAERLVATMEPQIRTPRQDEAMALADAERLNITAACDHAMAVGDVRRALRLAATVPMGLLAERRALLFRLLVEDLDAPAELRARAWSTLANLASDVGDGAGQADAAAVALAAAEDAGDDALIAWARYFLVLGNWASGRLDGLDQLIDAATVGFEQIGSAHGVASMHWIGSQVERDPVVAIDLADRAVSEFRDLAIPSGLAHALEGRALLALRAGDRTTVRAHLAEAIAIVSGAGNSGCTAHCVESVAAFAADCGRYADARRLVDVAWVMREMSGHGMRVWEHEGHGRVMAALAGRPVEQTTVPVGLDVFSAAGLALAVLHDGAE